MLYFYIFWLDIITIYYNTEKSLVFEKNVHKIDSVSRDHKIEHLAQQATYYYLTRTKQTQN